MPGIEQRAPFRVVPARHGRKAPVITPPYELQLALDLAELMDQPELLAEFQRFSRTDKVMDALMRRVCLRALTRSLGDGVVIGTRVGIKHPETMEIGDGVFIGEQVVIHGRYDGRCKIGNRVWIGPQSFLDARDLIIEDDVGWGPGAKVLGSEHTGLPVAMPIIATDLRIAPVRVEAHADIGVNAVLLPGVTIGRGSIVGAGAVVTHDVPPYSTVAGVPARVISQRDSTTAVECIVTGVN